MSGEHPPNGRTAPYIWCTGTIRRLAIPAVAAARQVNVASRDGHRVNSDADLDSADQSQEDEHGSIEPQNVIIVEASEARSDLRFRHGSDLVDHQPARFLQAIGLTRFDRESEQRRGRGIRRECADGDRCCRVEPVILNYDHRTRLPGVIPTAGYRPDLSAFHESSGAAVFASGPLIVSHLAIMLRCTNLQ